MVALKEINASVNCIKKQILFLHDFANGTTCSITQKTQDFIAIAGGRQYFYSHAAKISSFFIFGSMRVRSIFIVLFMSVAIANPVAAQDQKLPSAGSNFEHQWKSGSQQYHLSENWLTGGLLAAEESRLLQPSESHSSSIEDSLVKPVGFEEQSGSTADFEKHAGPELEIAASFPVKNIDMLREELQLHQAAIKADDQISEAVKSSRLQILANANDALQKCLELQGQREHYESEVEQIEKEKSVLKDQLEQQIEPGTPDVDANTDSESLTVELKTLQNDLEKRRKNWIRLNLQSSFIPNE